VKSKTEKLLDELVKLHPKYIDLSLDRLKLLLKIYSFNPDFITKSYKQIYLLWVESNQLCSI